MKILIQAAVVTLFAASAAQAQQAVQWSVSDGGNGHWYQLYVAASAVSWTSCEAIAIAGGGHLASVTSSAEWQFIQSVANIDLAWNPDHGPWLGGFQDQSAPDYSEPAGGWRWSSGEAVDFSAWWVAQPSDSCDGGREDFLHIIDRANMAWNDIGEPSTCSVRPPTGAIIEWSADCNADGIVDYGQILQGQLADTNSDGVPDICQPPTCADADIFRDFNVNGADLGILLSQWGPANPSTVSDITRDGVVDGADLGVLLSFWGACP